MKKLEILAAPLEERSLKLLLFGAGELGKEIAIEAQRLGMEVVAVDRYERAPAQGIHSQHNWMLSTPISPPASGIRSTMECKFQIGNGIEI